MKPEQLALQVRVPLPNRLTLEAAVKGLELFPKLETLVKTIPVKLLTAGTGEIFGDVPTKQGLKPNNVGGCYIRDRRGNLDNLFNPFTEIRLNVDMKSQVSDARELKWKPLGWHPLKPADVWSGGHGADVFTCRLPIDQFDTGLLVHEIGHHVTMEMSEKDVHLAGYLDEAARSTFMSGRWISRYAMISPDEWAAETFSAYVFAPDELREFDRLSFEAMKATGV